MQFDPNLPHMKFFIVGAESQESSAIEAIRKISPQWILDKITVKFNLEGLKPLDAAKGNYRIVVMDRTYLSRAEALVGLKLDSQSFIVLVGDQDPVGFRELVEDMEGQWQIPGLCGAFDTKTNKFVAGEDNLKKFFTNPPLALGLFSRIFSYFRGGAFTRIAEESKAEIAEEPMKAAEAMSIRTDLVSNHANWNLVYKGSPMRKYTLLEKTALVVASAVAWPFTLLCGVVMLPYHSVKYFKARWNQYKTVTVIKSNKIPDNFAANRVKYCEEKIEKLKSRAIYLMEKHLKKPSDLGLSIPEKRGFRDYVAPQLPKEYWRDFPWNEFMAKDFFQLRAVAEGNDRIALNRLEKIRIKLNCLSNQKSLLSDPVNGRLVFKAVAETSFVKNAFKRQESKEWIITSVLCLFPCGLFFDSSVSNRATYEGRKDFLPAGTDLYRDADLVEAHNRLVSDTFVVPYIKIR